jgi:hypothetical protein
LLQQGAHFITAQTKAPVASTTVEWARSLTQRFASKDGFILTEAAGDPRCGHSSRKVDWNTLLDLGTTSTHAS